MPEPTDEKAFEREYKYKIVDTLAQALHPGWWDPKEKFSDSARTILQDKARDKAKQGLRAIAQYIKEPH